MDETAIRTTRDVDILIRPADFSMLKEAMPKAGFRHRQIAGLDLFVEDPKASDRDAVHIVLSGQMMRPNDYEPNPDIVLTEKTCDFQTVQLETLVRMKLNSYRRKDQVHLQDMISVGLIDDT